MKQNRRNDKKEIWSLPQGRRIVLAGLDNKQKQIYAENLAHICSQNHVELTVTEKYGQISSEDYVLLFAQIDKETYPGPKAENAAVKLLLEQMKMIAERRPQAVVLVSDCQVYGKQFGEQRKQKEEELGYVAHTAKEETAVYFLRMAEHMACRMAREEGLHIRVVRQELREETENLEQMLEGAMAVLVKGKDGEIYNLPSSGIPFSRRENMEDGAHSPLSSMEIIPDTEKIETLMRSGRDFV